MVTFVIIFGGWAFIVDRLRKDVLILQKEMGEVHSTLKENAGILITLAQQDIRLKMVEQRMFELSHGKGFIFEIPGAYGPFPPNTK